MNSILPLFRAMVPPWRRNRLTPSDVLQAIYGVSLSWLCNKSVRFFLGKIERQRTLASADLNRTRRRVMLDAWWRRRRVSMGAWTNKTPKTKAISRNRQPIRIKWHCSLQTESCVSLLGARVKLHMACVVGAFAASLGISIGISDTAIVSYLVVFARNYACLLQLYEGRRRNMD